VQPSLALFATLEGLMRHDSFDNHPMAMAAVLAAVQALLEPCAAGGCSCSQAHTPSSSARATGTATTNSSKSVTNASSTPLLPGPGVIEAVASVAVTVSKILLSVADKPTAGQATLAEMATQREVVFLGAHLSSAVLQLALQQVQQQQQQQGHRTKAVMCLAEAAHRLLRHAARGAVADMQQQEQYKVIATAVIRGGAAAQRGQTAAIDTQLSPADSRVRKEHLKGTSRLLYALLYTGHTRLLALQSATAAVWAAGVGNTGATHSAFAAAAWCAAHSGCPDPMARVLAAAGPDMLLRPKLNRLHEKIKKVTITRAPLMGCGTYGCVEVFGPSETWLVHNRRGVLCGGCGVVRYCCPEHARHSWPTHRKVCRRLGAALGHAPTTCRDTGSSNNSSSSSRVAAATHNAARAPALPPSVSASAGGNPSHSISKDSTPGGDQLGLTSGGRVCSWCGKASQQLLRCGRCKAAWYCDADHQRAAWKAGHKQECGSKGNKI
jgi:hypothetical protein